MGPRAPFPRTTVRPSSRFMAVQGRGRMWHLDGGLATPGGILRIGGFDDEQTERPDDVDGVGGDRMRAGPRGRARPASQCRLDAAGQDPAPGAGPEARHRADRDEHRAGEAPGPAEPPHPARRSARGSPETGGRAPGRDEVMVRLEFHDPTGAIEMTQAHAARVAALAGKRVGFVSNEQWQAYRMLPLLKGLLEADFPGIEVLPIDAFPQGNAVIGSEETAALVKASGVDAVVIGNAA